MGDGANGIAIPTLPLSPSARPRLAVPASFPALGPGPSGLPPSPQPGCPASLSPAWSSVFAEEMAVEIVDLPTKNGDVPENYDSLPEGIMYTPTSIECIIP